MIDNSSQPVKTLAIDLYKHQIRAMVLNTTR